MNLFEKVKTMSLDEMKTFMYWVYLCGNKDGAEDLQDSPSGYFGGYFLELDADDVIPYGDVNTLYDKLEQKILDQ